MHPIFNAFERHYRRTRYEVVEPMMRSGTFEFQGSWSAADGFNARLLTPDGELTTRFIVLMRRFLNPAEPIYYRAVWQLLSAEFASELPADATERFARYESALASGVGIRFQVSGEEMTAEQIYRMVADGAVFSRHAEAQARLAAIARIPFGDELFRYQFYDYSMAAFQVVSLLFTLIRQVEQTSAFKARFGDPDPSSYRCIFCLQTAGRFVAEEHIIPEALGVTDWVLPRGYVCDRCNNGPLAKLDEALAHSSLFAYQRLHYVPYDKAGRLPEIRMGSMTWKRTGPLDIKMIADPGSQALKLQEELDDGWVRFSMSDTLEQKFDERQLARALCKIALELVAADHGLAYACHERYNSVRTFVRQGGSFRNSLLMRTVFTPQPSIVITYIPLERGTVVDLNVYGMRFLLNLEEQPLLQLRDDSPMEDIIAFSLYGKSSWRQFTISMAPSVDTLGNLPQQYWPEIVAFPLETSEGCDAPTGELGTSAPQAGALAAPDSERE